MMPLSYEAAQPPLPPGIPSQPVAGQEPWAPGQPGPDTVSVVNPTPTGTPGLDMLVDVAGDTDLYCGPNQDLLLFQSGSGFDLVFGFDPSDGGDLIAIEENVNGTEFWSADQLAIADTEAGALVDLGGGNGFLLAGVSLAQLDASDFTVHPAFDGGQAVF